jgi:hypothetical protein
MLPEERRLKPMSSEQKESCGDEMVTAECGDCGEVTKVYADNHLCDDCEAEYVYCSICEERHHQDDTCRHLFWDRREGGWAGPGADEPCYQRVEEYKEAIVFALRRVKPKILPDLADGLRNRTLRFCLAGTMFGTDHIEIQGRNAAREQFYWTRITDHLQEEVDACNTEEQACFFENGFQWIMALDAKTPRETALILQWIEEIQKGEPPCSTP